jgi:Uma2 family endonuclease
MGIVTAAFEPKAAATCSHQPKELHLENGERTNRETFHAWYETTPDGFKAELISGEVVVASPLQDPHGNVHGAVNGWLWTYAIATMGVGLRDNTTMILGDDSEPQPDSSLIVRTEYGGQTRLDDRNYRVGPPELIVEVANSSGAIDLHRKKDDYEKSGVLEYVVVLLRDLQVRWFRNVAGVFAERPPSPDGMFRSEVFPGLWLNPRALLHDDGQALLATLNLGLQSKEHAEFVQALASRRADRER